MHHPSQTIGTMVHQSNLDSLSIADSNLNETNKTVKIQNAEQIKPPETEIQSPYQNINYRHDSEDDAEEQYDEVGIYDDDEDGVTALDDQARLKEIPIINR